MKNSKWPPSRIGIGSKLRTPILTLINARNAKYDTSQWPFLFRGDYDGPVPALAYVIAVKNNAWPLEDVRRQKRIEYESLIIEWHEGMNSALDQSSITGGRDIGYVTVQQKQPDGSLSNAAYDMTFAFAFKIFYPNGLIHVQQ